MGARLLGVKQPGWSCTSTVQYAFQAAGAIYLAIMSGTNASKGKGHPMTYLYRHRVEAELGE